jgi:phospholipase C
LWLYAPNGFHRRFSGKIAQAVSAQWHGNSLTLTGEGQVIIRDEAYGQPEKTITLTAGQAQTLALDLTNQWYDISVSGEGFCHRFAGHIETGRPSMTDPALGGPAVMKLV